MGSGCWDGGEKSCGCRVSFIVPDKAWNAFLYAPTVDFTKSKGLKVYWTFPWGQRQTDAQVCGEKKQEVARGSKHLFFSDCGLRMERLEGKAGKRYIKGARHSRQSNELAEDDTE